MKRFSERIGVNSPKSIIQKDNIDDDLKNALWNGLVIFYLDKMNKEWYEQQPEHIQFFWVRIWSLYFKRRIDEKPEKKDWFIKDLKNYFFSCNWYEVYELLEFIIEDYTSDYNDNVNERFITYCNDVLERELSAYRIINKKFVPITSGEEIEAIESALRIDDIYKPVKEHLSRAVQHLSKKANPDYRNSIKESISAVESFCSILAKEPKPTLGQALKKIESEHGLHPALKKSFTSLYGYTSDANGIRHALLEQDNLKQEDAIFMLVSCSAFVNYLMKKIASVFSKSA